LLTATLDYHNLSKKYDKKSKEKSTEINTDFTKYANEENIQINPELVNNIDVYNVKIEEMKDVNEKSCWLDITKDEKLTTNKRKKHKKIFFFIVDALRLDFMVNKKEEKIDKNDQIRDKREINHDDSNEMESKTSNEDENNTSISSSSTSTSSTSSSSSSSTSSSSSSSSPYNKFKHMHELLRNNATQTSFFGFRADPPTVTSQRLKGGMTY
jgi:hypothetical protein